MNDPQLLSGVQELQRKLSRMRLLYLSIENLCDDAFNGFEDEWPDTLKSDLNILQRMFHRFREALLGGDFLELIVAGRPPLAELAVDAEAALKKAASGLLEAFDTLLHEDSPASSFASWHRFEHVFRDFLTRQSRMLAAAINTIQLESNSNDPESNDTSRSGKPAAQNNRKA